MAMKLGIDPVHFGVMITVNMEIGMITPPVGLNLYVRQRHRQDGPDRLLQGGLALAADDAGVPHGHHLCAGITTWLPKTVGMM